MVGSSQPPPSTSSPWPELVSRGAALAAFVVGLAVTAWAAWQTADADRSEAEARFRGHVDRLVPELARRVTQAEYGLRGARAMTTVNGHLNHREFHAYVASRSLATEFPGIRGFGFIERVRRADVATFEARESAEQGAPFAVRSSGTEPELLVVKYLEPFAANAPSRGIDIGAEPVRREAAERAIATGTTSLTGPIRLFLGQASTPGWLLLLPVYRSGSAPSSPPQRSAQLVGLLFAPIAANEVLAPVKASLGGFVEFNLVDAASPAAGPLFDSRAPADAAGVPKRQPMFAEVRRIDIAGRPFDVRAESSRMLESEVDLRDPVLVAVTGASLSLLLSAAMLRIVRSRQEAEAHGRAQERLVRATIDSIPARLSYWGRDLRCRLANVSQGRAYGRTPQQLVGVRLDELLPPQWREDARRRAAISLAGEPQQFEAERPGPDGRPHTDLVYYVPDMHEGRVEGFFVFAWDITDLKEAREAARRASEAKSQFLSNISHEIRTPMNAVLGMLELLRMTPLDARQGDYAGKADAAARSLLSLLNDVLDFSRIEAGKMTLDPRPFSLATLLGDLEVILHATLGSKPIALRFELDPALPPLVEGDDMRLRQILINLGGNAIKFTRQGEVAVVLRQLARHEGSVDVEIAVSDTGIGIAPDQQQRIFADFSQAAASTTREFGGSGLGLAICRRLTALMGSSLAVESAPGQGSRFHFRLALPIVDGAPASPPPSLSQHAPAAAKPLAGLRLLVVEDNAVNQQVARELLQSVGAEIELAGNGREAVLAVAGRGPFDVVLMDVQMPVMDGYQATRDIRQKLCQVDLPIIAMTANAMEADREAARAAGMDDHVGKPFVLPDLVATILHHVGAAARPDASVASAESPSSPRAAGPIAREEAIARLGGDEALYRRIVPSFRRDLQLALDELAAAGADDAESVTRLFHTLKATAATVGAYELSAVAATAEQASREGAAPVDAALRAALEGEIRRALEALASEPQDP